MFGTLVSDMQENISIADNKITGTLKYLSAGSLVDYWGGNHFIGLKFTDQDEADKIEVGILNPVELDADMNGAWLVTDTSKPLKVIVTKGEETQTFEYDLSELVLASE